MRLAFPNCPVSSTVMNCQHCCTRRTLSLFIRSLTTPQSAFPANRLPLLSPHPSRFRSDKRPPPIYDASLKTPRKKKLLQLEADAAAAAKSNEIQDALTDELSSQQQQRKPSRPAWAIQKEALREKFNGEAWSPRKKLSPDTMEGIRHLHHTQPEKFTTPILADHFKVSPEAIRRILKSKWRPSDAEYEERMQRWNKRGERIWENLVEMGVKPPKRWRDMGVGRARDGEVPRWKSRRRNLVEVGESGDGADVLANYLPDEDILPTVDKHGRSKTVPSSVPLSQRL
ncbi:Required for respiratory growth protein 9 mitochondrial [Exserohilum turcicum]